MGLLDSIDKVAQSSQTPHFVVEASTAGGEFKNLITETPVAPDEYEGAFAKVYELSGLNPKDYRIVDDTVRFSAWQQSKRLEGGNRDVITLYSYSARFQRISPLDLRAEELVKELAGNLRKRRLSTRRTPGTGLGTPCTYTALPSDWQFGKSAIRTEDIEHGETGVEQTQWRIERFVEESQRRVKKLRKIGRNIEGIAIGHMGDPIENIADSYEQQTFQIELNLDQQIEIALRMMVFVAEELLPLAETQTIFSALCNHGQLARRGTKVSITDDSDNVQTLLMHLQRDYIVGPKFKNCQWVVPTEEMITTLNLSGVDVAVSHGQKISGQEDTWLLKQTAVVGATRGVHPRLWLTAHRHSQRMVDLGAIHCIQAATTDGGSKSFCDKTAVYGTPGTTVLLIGNHDERGFSDIELL